MKNRTDHGKMGSRFTKRFKRCLASVVCIVGIAAVCFGVAGYQNKIHAAGDQVVTRGIVKSLGQIPQTKKDMYDQGKTTYAKGTKENPFLILEVVPYLEYSEFGYQISGCEPVDISKMCGDMASLSSMNTAEIVQQSEAYFFKDEPESNPDAYTKEDDKPKAQSDYGESYEGYYEVVQDGSGNFSQNDENEIVKNNNGNLIWHTMCATEKEKEEVEFLPLEELNYKLEGVGTRFYTSRVSSAEDPVYKTSCYYYYKSNDNFLKKTLRLSDEEADDYSVIIKTITPAELNSNPKWADYADLYIVSHKSHVTNLKDVWQKYHRDGYEVTTGTFTDSFVNTSSNKNRDITWEVTRKMYDKITADDNYAALIMDADTYTTNANGPLKGSMKTGYKVNVYDWNLKKTSLVFDSSSHLTSNNNFYKLAVMLLSMKPNLFKSLYLDSNLIDDQGNFLLRDQKEEYWSIYTFLLVDPESTNVSSVENYWNELNKWENYETVGNITTERNVVNRRFFSFNSDNDVSQSYLNNTIDTTGDDYRYKDFKDFVKRDDPDSNGKVSPSDAVRYILGYNKNDSDDITGELKVLDIEPCYDSKEGYSLKESYIRMMVPKFTGTVKITHMTTAEFIGSAEDLNSTYNMIFMGLDDGAYSKEKKNLYDAGIDKWQEELFTTWNDTSMNGKIYFHTGDKMIAANNTVDGRSRSVEFLYSAKNNSNVGGQELRFSGNDITKIKQTELEDFLKAGYPIVAVPYLYETDTLRIDQYSNICKFIKENRNSSSEDSTLLKISDVDGIYSVVKKSRAEVEFTKLPEKYNGETGDGTTITNPNYLERDSSLRSLMSFKFKVDDNENKKYSYRIYLDQNQDGKFSDDELYYKGKAFHANDGEQSVTCKLSKLYYGLIQWKIEVYEVKDDTSDRSVRFVETGCSAARNMAGLGKNEINVLQIMPKDGTYDGKLNLSNNNLFSKYYSQLEDYKINIKTITLDEFEGKFRNKAFTSYNYAKDLTDEDYDRISKEMTADQQELYSYHMYIIGFGDVYGARNLDNTYGAVDFLKFYIASGKSVLFTHDLTSLHNSNSGDFGYSANTLLRDTMGMNRYEAISKNVSDKSKMQEYQSKFEYDTVTDIAGNTLDQTHGFTYYAMKRLGWPSKAKISGTDNNMRMPYRYMIKNLKGESICPINEATLTGFNNNNDLTTKVSQSNEGQITEYPYKIDSTFTISDTHAQWYQLDMEDPEVTVWYCLADDKKASAWNATDSNGRGTAATYGVSPNDAANNYYIYSKGNVFYSGVGHSTITQDMEAKLFINTMIAAYRASYQPPMIEVLNPDAELLDVNTMNYQMTANDEYNDEISSSSSSSESGKVQFEGQGTESNEYIKVRFSPVELNAISTTLTCAIYYEADGATHYVQRIYDAETDEEIECTLKDGKCVYEGIENMNEYYFYYPKKYLNNWKDGDVTKSARRTINFYIKNDKAKLPRYQTLDMSVRALFKLD